MQQHHPSNGTPNASGGRNRPISPTSPTRSFPTRRKVDHELPSRPPAPKNTKPGPPESPRRVKIPLNEVPERKTPEVSRGRSQERGRSQGSRVIYTEKRSLSADRSKSPFRTREREREEDNIGTQFALDTLHDDNVSLMAYILALTVELSNRFERSKGDISTFLQQREEEHIKHFENVVREFQERLEGDVLRDRIQEGTKSIYEKINSLEERVSRMENALMRIENQISRLSLLETKIDNMLTKDRGDKNKPRGDEGILERDKDIWNL